MCRVEASADDTSSTVVGVSPWGRRRGNRRWRRMESRVGKALAEGSLLAGAAARNGE
jgi:hypothetical protein